MTAVGKGARLAGSGAKVGAKAGPALAVTVTGIPAIDRRLKKLDAKTQKKLVKAAMRVGMKIVQKRVKDNLRNVFTDPTRSGRESESSGATIRGVKVRATKRGRKRIGIDVRINGGAYIGKTFYAAFHEYGTSRLPASPAMAPAFRQKRREARSATTRALLGSLKAEVRKLGKS